MASSVSSLTNNIRATLHEDSMRSRVPLFSQILQIGLSVRYHWQILIGEHNCCVSNLRLFNMFTIFGA